MTKSNKFSPELRERAIRMVYEVREAYDSQWAAIEAVAGLVWNQFSFLRQLHG